MKFSKIMNQNLKTNKSIPKLQLNNSKINESIRINDNESLSNMNVKDVKVKRLRFSKKLNSQHLSGAKGYLNRIETVEEVIICFLFTS